MRSTGNFSLEAGRKIFPSSNVPSGMRTFTSRSTMTSYLRSDVDHWVVNMLWAPLQIQLSQAGAIVRFTAATRQPKAQCFIHRRGTEIAEVGVFHRRKLLSLRSRRLGGANSDPCFTQHPEERSKANRPRGRVTR